MPTAMRRSANSVPSGTYMRLGPFHGLDDPWYVSQHNAEFWCQPGGKAYKVPGIDHELRQESSLPVPDAEIVEFPNTRQPECALLIRRGKGTLITCDAIQHYGDYRYHNLPARLLMPFLGFPKKTIVGPMWLKYMSPKDGSLRADFEPLLDLEYDRLVSAHGSFLDANARSNVQDAIARAFD